MGTRREALFWQSEPDGSVRCSLCNHFCRVPEGGSGICRFRRNIGGRFHSLSYGRLVAANVDPIEKKPFYHFLPGSLAYSVSAPGCNFACPFCQNYSISREASEEDLVSLPETEPVAIVKTALSARCRSISYTYTEPTVFFEYALETARAAKEKGLRNNFVTNGYMSGAALEETKGVLDAANVDLKGDEEFYRRLCRARRGPVVDNIRRMRELGIWVEVTTLVIPGENDSEKVLKGIAGDIAAIGADIPWHVSRFFPTYRMTDHSPTAVESLHRAREIGKEAGIRHVYTGNIPGDEGENTVCPGCGATVFQRHGYRVHARAFSDGACAACGRKLEGVFL